MDGTLRTILDESIHTNQLLQKLLKAQLQTRDDNKKVDKDDSSNKPQPSQNPVEEVVGQATKRKRISSQSQRDEERKKARKETTEERR